MSDSIPSCSDGDFPSTSVQSLTDRSTPKKGILKRPSWKSESQDVKDKGSIQHRPSPDRFPDKNSSRIPKLQVTWWEKNAVALIGETSDENNTDSEHLMRDLGGGVKNLNEKNDEDYYVRQTAILDSDDSDFTEGRESFFTMSRNDVDMDDTMSMTSSIGSTCSQVVGKWWNGKETRFIPHCQKKGCNHANHNSGEYLTPTQRRNRELAQLKKELRQVRSERDDKEKHLSSLREKVKEIEVFNDAQVSLVERQKTIQKDNEMRENHEKEKKLLEKKHAVRVNQLIQETMSSREECIRLSSRIKELESKVNVPKVESTTQTEVEQLHVVASSLPPDPYDNAVNEKEVERREPDVKETPSSSVQFSPNPLDTQLFCSQEALNHMQSDTNSNEVPNIFENTGVLKQFWTKIDVNSNIQACQNEAFIWRTKAAQLEIIVKDQLLTIANYEEKEKERARIESRTELKISSSQMDRSEEISVRPEKIVILDSEPSRKDLLDECLSEKCRLNREQQAFESENIKENMKEGKLRISELEEDIVHLRKEIEKSEANRHTTDVKLAELREKLDNKEAEIAASMSTSNRIQNERDNLQKALEYMEQRLQVYRNTLLDYDIVISDEPKSDWLKTLTDPRYNVMHCQYVQTDLTSQKLNKDESEFLSVQRNLHEKNELEERLEKQQDDLEDGLSKTLEESLAKYKQQDEYWTERIALLESQNTRLKAENEKLCREVEEQKVKAHLQKAELERKLVSSIEHVQIVSEGINKPKRDVECQAQPRHINKYVACRPNTKSKSTEIQKGELFDEVEERLRVSQTELMTSRRQINILQQKLVYIVQNQADQKNRKASVRDSSTKSNDNADDLTENENLLKKIIDLEAEKAALGVQEKVRIQKLANEFDNVRGKLNEYMELYSKEKQWLQWRIANLKKDNNELQQALQQSPLRNAVSECDLEEIQMETESIIGETGDTCFEAEVAKTELDEFSNHVPFSNLAHVLNLVRSDLEQVLTEIEETERQPSQPDSISQTKNTDILFDVLQDWNGDDRHILESQLKRSREERKVLSNKNKDLVQELSVKNAELELYRSDQLPVDNEHRNLTRSSSYSHLKNNGSKREDVAKWENKSGVLFREVNALRKKLAFYFEENKELKYQLTLLRGVNELRECSEKLGDEIIVHDDVNAFECGSTKTSVSCSILVRNKSADNLQHTKPETSTRRRCRSASKKVLPTRNELEQREIRRELRIQPSGSLSSSVASLSVQKDKNKNLMTQSWHESASQKSKNASLRDRIGKLSIENDDLRKKLSMFEKQINDKGNTRVLELEKETDELKETVLELLQKVKQNAEIEEKDEQLTILETNLRHKQEVLKTLESKIEDLESERKHMYLEMFKKGQRTAQIELEEGLCQEIQTPEKIALKFLNSALYHYFMNKGNPKEHLIAIMGILGFSHNQQQDCLKRLKLI